MPAQNTPLRHNDYFELIIFKKRRTRNKLRKQNASCPFVREIYIYKGH